MRNFASKEVLSLNHLFKIALPVTLAVIVAVSLWFASPVGQDIKLAFGYTYSYDEGPAPTYEQETNTSGSVDSSGTFTADVKATSIDGNVSVTVSQGTVGKKADNTPIARLSVKKLTSPPASAPPPPNADMVLMYDFGPDGATFDQPVTLSFTYADRDIPSGVDEADLVIVYWDGSDWVRISNISVDPATNTITGEIDHFTTFAVMASTAPASFTLSNLSVSPAEVGAGDTVRITVKVTNTGDLSGDYEVRVNAANVVYKKAVSLDGGTSQDVSFSLTAGDIGGKYYVTVGDLTGSFTVKVAVVTPPPTTAVPTQPVPTLPVTPTVIAPTTTAAPPQTTVAVPEIPVQETNWLLIILVVAAVVIATGVVLWYAFRNM